MKPPKNVPGIFFIKLIFCFSNALHAQDQNEGRAFFEAENYGQAKIAYENMLDDKLEPWQKEIVRYNIATALLAEGKWEEAILGFEILFDEGIRHPLLKQKVLSNLALARVRQLEAKTEALKALPNPTYDNYNQIYVLFHKVLKDIDSGETAWCELQSLEGAPSCTESLYLENIRLEVKSNLNHFLTEYQNYRIDHATVEEGVSALIFGEKVLLDFLNSLENHEFSANHKKQYLADYLIEVNSWKGLWDKLDVSFKAGKTDNAAKLQELFKQAHQTFLESFSEAENANFSDSLKSLKKSKSDLTELLNRLFSNSSVKDVLDQLLILYGLALIRDPVQEAYLDHISETQIAFEEAIKKSVDAFIFSSYEKSLKYLKFSLESLNDSYSVNARIFAEVARFYISNILEQADPSAKHHAASVLESAIAKQEFVILLNRLRGEKQGDDKTAREVDQILPELQQLTLTSAHRFLDAAMSQQKQAFTEPSSGKSRCQCHPWDEVMPLFSDGYANAEFANMRLLAGDYRPITTLPLQKKAVDLWKEALAKLHSSSASKKSSEQSQSQEMSESEQQAEAKNLSKEGATNNVKLNEILRTIQDMEKDDQSKPQQIKTYSGEGEERPW